MGTLSLVVGIIFILSGLYLLIEGLGVSIGFAIYGSQVDLYGIIIGAVFIVAGSLLISKYDADRLEEKEEKGS